jgi:hypothetical protein
MRRTVTLDIGWLIIIALLVIGIVGLLIWSPWNTAAADLPLCWMPEDLDQR